MSQKTKEEIKGNWTKFLINRSGFVTGRFEPEVSPSEIEKDIQVEVDAGLEEYLIW